MHFEFCPIGWTFRRTSIIPIMECIGESDNKIAEGILLQTAANLIEKAEDFCGMPITTKNKPSTDSQVQVYFNLHFKSDEYFKQFAQFIESEKGHY